MKFTCDSCGSAYMISDDKVGPGGVKVRCKKCGNVVTVRRGDEPPVVAPAAAPAAPAGGLDDELGSAFDHAFGDPPAAEPAAAAPAPAAAAAPAQAAPPATEWYVAIGEAQVGPLPLAEVKKKWEAGAVGPDSLVWRPGMADWGPLSGVPDLAAYLSPVPQPAPVREAPAAAVAPVAAAAPRALTPAPAPAPAPSPAAPAPEVEWKPAGASALAALASEELASREAAAAPAAPRPAPARSLMDQLPDSGGVDPTGAIPLPIKGMEKTDERPVRKSSVARGAEQVRHKRTVRNVVLGVVALVAVAAAAGFGVYTFTGRDQPPAPKPPPPQVAAPVPAPPPAAAPTPPPAQAAPPAPAEAAATPPAPAPAAAPPAPPAPAAEKPAPEKVAAAEKPAPKAAPPPAPKAAAAKPAPAPKAAPAAAVAAAKPAVAEKPAAAPKKKDSVLDFDQGAEDDLTAALGGTGSRSVYVPPKPGGAAAAPDRLSDAQITESVKLHVDALRRCASEQQAREPGAKGTLKMAWTIQADGSPKDVRCLTPDLANGPFAQCITGVVKGIRFPRLGDPKGQQVSFPFGY